MSQRARAHTTGATRTTTEPAPSPSPPAPERGSAPGGATSAPRDSSLSADVKAAGVEPLARALRAMATELERDPALARRVADAMQAPGGVGAPTPDDSGRAQDATSKPAAAATEDADDVKLAAAPTTRVNRSFHPRIVTGTPPDLGMGVPDPFALAERLGEAGLRAALADLRLGSLRAMIREHRLDPAGRLVGVNDAAKLRAVILDAVHSVRPTNADAAPPKSQTRRRRKADP